jgi:Dolichyl-phosphate-mannose-protein mannosyltransferase
VSEHLFEHAAVDLGLRRRTVVAVTLAASLVGAAALAWSLLADLVLAYGDSRSHLDIARRVLDSRTPSFAQLGTVWLPVPHILLQPFILIDPLWQTGLAGGLVGLICLAITAVAVFGSIRLMTQHRLAPWIGVAVLLTNPNLLYIHTTALTEPVLLMAMTASAYFLVRWTRDGRISSLVAAGALSALAVGSRYDGWFYALASSAVVLVVVLWRTRSPQKAEGLTLAYCVLPVFAMFLWFYYNWLIWGDALEFQRGQYSAQFQQASFAALGKLKTRGDLPLSILTYGLTALHTNGGLLLGLAGAGLATYLVSLRRLGGSMAPLVFLSAVPFNILALYGGQSIIMLPETDPAGYFNVRYGLMLVPAVAVFAAYGFDRLARVAPGGLVATGAAALLLAQVAVYVPQWPLSVITITEGLYGPSARPPRSTAAQYLRAHYAGGGILLDDSDYTTDGGSLVLFETGLPLREYIATYSDQLWARALTDPASQVEWIFMHTHTREDRVAGALLGSPVLDQQYTLVFEDQGFGLYQRTTAAAAAHTQG